MKLLFLSIALAFSIGASIGNYFGINVFASGVGGVVVASLNPSLGPGYALVGFDVSGLNAQIGAYMRKYSKVIQTQMFSGIVLEKYMASLGGVSDEYVHLSSNVDEVLQAYQEDWTPKGSVDVIARVNKVRQIKLDFELKGIDALFQTYIGFLADEGKSRKDWPFVRWVIQSHLLPKIQEEVAWNSYNGIYVAPTATVAGASIASVDGLGTIVSAEITASNIVPFATGALTATNIVDKTEQFVDALDIKIRNKPGNILMSSTNARRYHRDYRTNFGGNSNYSGKDNLSIDATNKTIVGIPEMEGSDRIIFGTKGNLIKMYDKIDVPGRLQNESAKRVINIFGDFKRGYGIKRFDQIAVNDQA